MAVRNLNEKYEKRVRLDTLNDFAGNPNDGDVGAVSTMIEENGWYGAIVADVETRTILAGHTRRRALEAQGEQFGPVLWVRADDLDHARAILLADNRASRLGHDLPDLLQAALEAQAATARGLVGTGFDGDDLDDLIRQQAAVAAAISGPRPGDDEPVPEPPAEPVTKRGDVWVLGAHRLMCGDCRDADDVARVLDGRQINVAFTSPPYAEQRTYDESSGFKPIPPDEYVEWFAPVAANVAAHLATDGSWFVNIKADTDGIDTNLYVLDLVIAHARDWGWHFATEFCWQRGGFPQQPRYRFKNQFEPIYQFARNDWKFRPEAVTIQSSAAFTYEPGRGKSLASNQGSENEEWFAGRAGPGLAYPGNRLPTFASSHEATGHMAAFPVGLPAWFARAFSDHDDVIFDPFAGSGSTLLASEQEGRVGVGIEISPAYCDVICARYQRLTGIEPVIERAER